MAYQSLYRRYRPGRFAEVRGQPHLVRALQNAVREGRVGHAYLFSGPRGTGKTSTARILAKVLNCEGVTDGEPCGTCASCRAIEAGTSFDVHELDAASNNGVEAVRDLIAKAALGTPGRTKVYILDEVHMLSAAASNALLKTLEEPPDHVVFVLATTDPQKVLPTIRSRTQHFEVRLLPAAELEALVDHVIADAGLTVSDEGRDHVLRAGAGSARDTLSALDQVVAAGGVADDPAVLDELVAALCDHDTGRALAAVEAAVAAGRGPRLIGEQLVGRLRDVFLTAVGTDLVRLADREREVVAAQADRLGAAGATRALEVLGLALVGIQDLPDPRVAVEIALVRLTRPDVDDHPAALADRLTRLERALADPGARPSVPPETPSTAGRRAGSPPPRPPARRPAAAARSALAGRSSSNPTAAPATPPSPPRESSPAEVPPASSPPPGGTGWPSRDELTLAWGDHILAALPQRTRVRFAGGRWTEVDEGGAVFGLPNPHHLRRCEEVRPEAEEALAAHFGVPLPIRLVVDGGGDDPAGTGSSAQADDADDEAVDPAELADATDVADRGIDRLTELFPGAELVEEP